MNVECGMWNAEWQGESRSAIDLRLLFRIRHSAFRIGWGGEAGQ